MDELAGFKQEINLIEFAACRGYEADRRESSRGSAVMRHPNGDKIIIAYIQPNKGGRPGWYFFSVRDSADNGSIVDFLQKRGVSNLGEVRKTLRAWSGSPRPAVLDRVHIPALVPVVQDRAAAVLGWEQAHFRAAVPYLIGRGLDAALMGSPRFADRCRVDRRGNVLFPHHDKAGLCGYEIKNKGFTGYSAGGLKGLWFSACRTTDKFLILAESAIDALSYHVLNPNDHSRYMSTGGKMNPTQPGLIRAAIERMPPGSVVVSAFDDDTDGQKMADEVKALTPSGVEYRRPLPPVGKDWNESLKAKLGLK